MNAPTTWHMCRRDVKPSNDKSNALGHCWIVETRAGGSCERARGGRCRLLGPRPGAADGGSRPGTPECALAPEQWRGRLKHANGRWGLARAL